MKKLGFTILAAAVLALPLCAQGPTTLRMDIPFEFTVGNSTAAPGAYDITIQSGSSVVQVQLAGSRSYLVQTSENGPYTTPQESKLIFHRYGSQYFLSGIQAGYTSRDLPMSRSERELTKTAAGQMQTVVVLAKR
jgi:hypothetical protein